MKIKPLSKKNLIMVVYSFSSTSILFSSQRRIIEELARQDFTITVICFDKFDEQNLLSSNLRVRSITTWEKNRFLGIFELYQAFFQSLDWAQTNILICHMTDFASALLSPFTRFLKIRHILWYAHVNFSKWLRISSWLVDDIITSTERSCPYHGRKLRILGQSIDEKFFYRQITHAPREIVNIVHVGRIDPSKQLKLLIEFFLENFGDNPNAKLGLIGQPTAGNELYLKTLTQDYGSFIKDRKILLLGPMVAHEVRTILQASDLFIHAFEGSLDRVLIEATMMGVPVLTVNKEYLDLVGYRDSTKVHHNEPSKILQKQLLYYCAMSKQQQIEELLRRQQLVLTQHALSPWIVKLLKILEQ